LPNITGDPVSLYEVLNSGPVVLSFYRGGWCPFCNLELQALQAQLSEFRALGANLIGISPETPDTSLSAIDKHQLEFEVLSDIGNITARQYGLLFTVYEEMRPLYLKWGLDVPASNGDDSWELPVPATYVIDTDSVVRAAHADKDYTRRMEPAQILATLRELKK
jgi:peroxiredoxin